MQKVFLSFALFIGFMFVQSAAFSQSVDTGNKIANEFLSMLDGTEETAQKAIAKYASKEVIANGMIPYGKSPKVSKVDEGCVYFTLRDDDENNAYYICTEGDKIVTFEWQE